MSFAVQSISAPCWQSSEGWHVSSPLQNWSSSQKESSGIYWQSNVLLHISSVQSTPSSQSASVGAFTHWSLDSMQSSTVQAMPSLQSLSVPSLQTPFKHSSFILDVRATGYVTDNQKKIKTLKKKLVFLQKIYVLFKKILNIFYCRIYIVIGFQRGSPPGMGENV